MVLRRPYAFLIKHFKLIHLLIVAIFTYLVIKNRSIYVYLSSVINDSVNRYDALTYINYGIFFLMFIGLMLCYIIFYLLKYKDKPRRIYIFTIVGYIIVGIYMFLLFNYMREFVNTVIDQKTIRLYRDILLITLFFQYYIIIVMLIRGLGFDIKKFDFNKDINELGIDSSDSEEVEVNTRIDTTNIMRSVRKQKREFSYFFKEFKIYIIVILSVVAIFLGIKGYNFFNTKLKVYTENQTVGGEYNITVKNSYNIDNYIVVNLDIFKYGKSNKFNINNLKLNIKNKNYLPNKNICYNFNKYGNCYKNQIITNNSANYIVVYEVEKVKDNIYLTYNEGYDNSYKIKLNLKKQ